MRGTYAAAAAVVTLAAMSGCSPGAGDEPPAGVGGRTFGPAATDTPSPTPTPSGSPGEVPQSCADLLPAGDVLRIVGVPLAGNTTFVYAGPLPDAGRTGRLTCGYGVGSPRRGAAAVAKVEITLNGYRDAATAAARLDPTAEAARAEGQTLQAMDLAGRRGVLMSDRVDHTYVLVDAERTLVITVRRGVVRGPALRPVLIELAAAVLGLPASATTTATTPTPAAR